MDSARRHISIQNLHLDIGRTRILTVDALDICGDGITAILGPNGAGKSVLLRIMHDILAPSAGQISFPIYDHVPLQAMVFQKPVLLRRTVAANIRFALAASEQPKSDVTAILENCGLLDHKDQPARSLSGGEQQRLALARALALKPDILFLDEPTANLDPAASLAIEAIIDRAAAKGTKVVMITHDVAQARRMAETIVFCSRGEVCPSRLAAEWFADPQSNDAQNYLAGKLQP